VEEQCEQIQLCSRLVPESVVAGDVFWQKGLLRASPGETCASCGDYPIGAFVGSAGCLAVAVAAAAAAAAVYPKPQIHFSLHSLAGRASERASERANVQRETARRGVKTRRLSLLPCQSDPLPFPSRI